MVNLLLVEGHINIHTVIQSQLISSESMGVHSMEQYFIPKVIENKLTHWSDAASDNALVSLAYSHAFEIFQHLWYTGYNANLRSNLKHPQPSAQRQQITSSPGQSW